MPHQSTPPASARGDAAGPPATLAQTVFNLLERIWRRLQERRQRERLRITLHELSERELIDIGVTRAEIDYIVACRTIDRLRDGTAYPGMR